MGRKEVLSPGSVMGLGPGCGSTRFGRMMLGMVFCLWWPRAAIFGNPVGATGVSRERVSLKVNIHLNFSM